MTAAWIAELVFFSGFVFPGIAAQAIAAWVLKHTSATGRGPRRALGAAALSCTLIYAGTHWAKALAWKPDWAPYLFSAAVAATLSFAFSRGSLPRGRLALWCATSAVIGFALPIVGLLSSSLFLMLLVKSAG